MTRKCIALLSGGLDSMLAIRLMQQQGIEVEALNFKTLFTCCQDLASQAARDLGVRVTILGQEDDYLDLVRRPKFGYGKGANPCVDCRIYMFQRARQFMERLGGDFIVSGEVVGQRPMSQKRRDLQAISYHSDLEDLLLRPLSAKNLPPTLPEREGWVDRRQLFDFCGRSRKGLIELAHRLELPHIPTPSTGCALTEPRFSRKVFDLLRAPGPEDRWDFELLKWGRHFRWDEHSKVIVGRNEAENEHLAYLHSLPEANSSAMLFPDNFSGPRTLLVGPCEEAGLRFAAGLLLRYSKLTPQVEPLIRIDQDGRTRHLQPRRHEQAERARTITAD